MEENMEEPHLRPTRGQYVKLCIGIVAYTVLLGVRHDLVGVLLRMVVAACAGGVLGWGLLQVRPKRALD